VATSNDTATDSLVAASHSQHGVVPDALCGPFKWLPRSRSANTAGCSSLAPPLECRICQMTHPAYVNLRRSNIVGLADHRGTAVGATCGGSCCLVDFLDVVDFPDEEGAIPVRSDVPGQLTARERAVLTVSATELGVAGVADVLGLTRNEVRAAVTSAIAKLGAGSKLEAVLIAYRRGDIDLPP
jgi:DNA-binding CsgD family transcriptional regulator